MNPARFEKQIIVTGTREYVIKVEHYLIELYEPNGFVPGRGNFR